MCGASLVIPLMDTIAAQSNAMSLLSYRFFSCASLQHNPVRADLSGFSFSIKYFSGLKRVKFH
jgi:hypothetical protein